MLISMTSFSYTGGSLNPARSFGPCVVLKQFNGYHWLYWAGPALGATIAAGFYKFIKVSRRNSFWADMAKECPSVPRI